MKSKKTMHIQRGNFFSEITYLTNSDGIVGSLKLPFFQNSGFFKGKDLYTFSAVDLTGNTYRIYKDGKSMGYIHLHAFRNLAQVNFVKEGPYQFSMSGVWKNNWVIRQGKKSIEMQDNDLYIYHIDASEEELVVACGLFISAKIKKDLIIFIPIILLIWALLIIF
jgi:hypothetical protein